MLTGYYCTNIFSGQAKELIAFYRDTLEIPFIKTDVDLTSGVYFGFLENAPILIYGIVKCSMQSLRDINHLFFKQMI